MKYYKNFAEKPHLDFLRTMLAQLLPEGSFAFKLRHNIGRLLDSMLSFYRVDHPDWSVADQAFVWFVEGNSVDLDRLKGTDGQFYDDSGQRIPATEVEQISTSSLMAAYGLWLLDVAQCSQVPHSSAIEDFVHLDVHERTCLQRLSHNAECIALAYRAFLYATRLGRGISRNVDEVEKTAKPDFSTMGRNGGLARGARFKALNDWAVARFEAGKWKTATAAADALMGDVLAHGKKINANLKPSNARLTLARWFREAEKTRSDGEAFPDFDVKRRLT